MKTLKLTVLGIILFLAGTSQAQVAVNVNVGSPPMWGPAGHSDVQYYYLPDVESYYDVPSSRFIYLERGKWVHRTYLPARYRNYDLYGGYKVVMTDYHGNKPYTLFKDYKVKYKKGYRGHAQQNIGSKPSKGQYKSKGNSGGSSYKSNNHNNNKSSGKSKSNGNNKGGGNGNGGGQGKNK